ncbi:MAG: hypothetical protein JSV63_02395 [Candidatus Aenigmatarchaeota archaeon]|nr:MAG: hypothetical protein JSV63_02395 [Candidatus Aenigmarchaeota archaeon]
MSLKICKNAVWIVSLLLFLINVITASAQLSCSVTSTCSDTVIFRMSSTDNAHAELASQTNYPYLVCCSDATATLGADCSSVRNSPVVNASAVTNAHVADPFFGTYTGNPICISSDIGDPYCTIMGGGSPCPANAPTCMGKISSITNAHVGNCASSYTNTICCRVNRVPVVDDIFPPRWPAFKDTFRGDITFNVSASDPDILDVIDRVRYVIMNATGSVFVDRVVCSPPGGPGCDITLASGMEWNYTWGSFSFSNIAWVENDVQVEASARSGLQWSAWRNEVFNVDNTPPDAWITGPPNGDTTGKLYNVTWDNNSYATKFILQYVEVGRFSMMGWENTFNTNNNYQLINLETEANGLRFCYRIQANDSYGIEGSWSCDPATAAELTSDCECTYLDTYEPAAQIESSPEYLSGDVFLVNWSGNDDPDGVPTSGIDCYDIQYRIIDNRSGNVLLGWTDWDAINNDNALVWTGPGTCSYVSCVDSLNENFDNAAGYVPPPFNGNDNHTYYFRVRAIDDAVGCANMELVTWDESLNGTWIDTTPPPDINVFVEDRNGDPVVSPDGMILTDTDAEINVYSDLADRDYTGVNETGITYWLSSVGSGYPIAGPFTVSCPDNVCVYTNSWSYEYNVTYRAYSRDRAGNTNTTGMFGFLVLKPLGLITTSTNLYMTLGSYDILPVTIANRQDIPESVVMSIGDDYPFSRFVDITEGDLSSDNRTLNFTLLPRESKTFHLIVFTADTNEYTMTITANSTRPGFEETINDVKILGLTVVYPQEFSGLSWIAVAALVIVAVAVYIRFGTRKDS